jgi:hypothetical protein
MAPFFFGRHAAQSQGDVAARRGISKERERRLRRADPQIRRSGSIACKQSGI